MKREAINPKSDYDRWQMRIMVVLRRHRDIWIQRGLFGTNTVRVGLNIFDFVAILIASGRKKTISLPFVTSQQLTFAIELSQRRRRQA